MAPLSEATLGPLPRYGLIGGSGVQVQGEDKWIVETPFGPCILVALDAERRVLFANRHFCTKVDTETLKADYAPPHEVNFKALIWALVVAGKCSGVMALGSAGTLQPETIPVGSVVAATDYYMVDKGAVTFWGQEGIGSFDTPADGFGRIHYSPANPLDQARNDFATRIQGALQPVLSRAREKVKFAEGQTASTWPLVPGRDTVYVNTVGPRFETRAEIRSYRGIGDVVGMTCGNEWILCEELQVPYFVICFCDNACNGLSTHPQGALQEYLENKAAIGDVTSAVVYSLVDEFSKTPASSNAAAGY